MNIIGYTLMHKTTPVAEIFLKDATCMIEKIGEIFSVEHLPVGVRIKNGIVNRGELNAWWRNRAMPMERFRIRDLLYEMNVRTTRLFLPESLGLCLSDAYWIKPMDSDLVWSKINFYDNAFSEDMGRLLFGEMPPSLADSLCSPDVTTEGCLKKRWEIIDGKRYLIKAGEPPYHQQPFNEVIASMIMERLGIAHIPYTLVWRNDEPYSACEDFVTPENELVTAFHVMKIRPKPNHHNDYMHYVTLCKENGLSDIEHALDEMLVLDYLVANEDRHFNNFGILRNPDTLKWTSAAPIYDSGSSLGYCNFAENLFNNLICKPFKKTFLEQLKLVTSFDWVEFEKLSGVEKDICDFLCDEKTILFIDSKRRAAIADLVRSRITWLEKYALEKQRGC